MIKLYYKEGCSEMKRFITVLSSLLILPAFAEVAPVYYDEIIEYSDDAIDGENADLQEAENSNAVTQNVIKRTTTNRSGAASRTLPAAVQTSGRTNISSRAVASGTRTTNTSSRAVAARTTKASNTASRTATKSRAAVTSRNTQNTKPVTARVGTGNNSVMPATRTSAYGTSAELTDSGQPLYNANSSRVSVNARRSTARLSTASTTATTPTITQEDVSTTANNLNNLAELTEYCKAQYAACMDNYCNVLDDNQGRCSCSKNLSNYEKTEAALTQATEAFQETIQKIRYIGLTGAQIESLFAETEAEIAMKSNSDSSRLKLSLDAIKKKIVDVSSPTSSGTTGLTDGLSLDLNGLLTADFTSSFDLNSFLGITTNTTSAVSNQRGETLFKTATNRCRTAVLNSCTAQGIDANIITNSYDLEIDKQCVAYERALNEANSEMKNNVTNATNILQQARLMLAQNKNSYDLRGCVAAIDECMQDEYVCGSDYEQCLDPTGKYLANGEVVKGGTPGVAGGQAVNQSDLDELVSNENPDYSYWSRWTSGGMLHLYSTWNYGKYNAWSVNPTENLGDYINDALKTWKSNYSKSSDKTTTENMAIYLLQKIGYIDSKNNDQVHGMCASVMKQCQNYTFDTKKNTKTYIPDNEVIRQYLVNTLSKIKVQQDTILAEYAEECRTDVSSCLATNGYDESNPNSTASKTAVNSCSAEITTCMSVGGYQVKDGVKLTLRAMSDWVAGIFMNCPTDYYLNDDGTNANVVCKACPSYQVGNSVVKTISSGGQVTRCSCPDNYYDVTNDKGELIGCSEESCSVNQYLVQNANTWSCQNCEGNTTSSGGTATACSAGE